MTLSFQQYFDKEKKKPTHFVEKIWQSVEMEADSALCQEWFGDGKIHEHYDYSDDAISMSPKIHTIRADASNRWKQGNKIHFVINNRTPKRFQFMPVLEVLSVQNIEIAYDFSSGSTKMYPVVYIDGKKYHSHHWSDWSAIRRLAQNDGFDTVKEFFKWFDKPFKGKIIHWTKHKY